MNHLLSLVPSVFSQSPDGLLHSNAVVATGIIVYRESVAIGELNEVNLGTISRNKIETTTHNDGSSSYVLGILRQSDPSLKINYLGNAASHVSIISDIENNVKSVWTFVFPSGVGRKGPAYVQSFGFDPASVDSKQGATIVLVWAGQVTEYADGAAP